MFIGVDNKATMTKEYDNINECIHCGGRTIQSSQQHENNYLCEAVVDCPDCGWESYWSYGWFEPEDDLRSDLGMRFVL